ncbi:unnamed protein product [Calicophoron daubneyi]|uniref:BZIP domain-containing protein n=1 Tax=Calicophoron daubneyi TaxID=300641 RepID=A0AAV2TUT9_CALDB
MLMDYLSCASTCSDVSSETGSAQSPFTMSTAMAPNISGSGNDVTTTYNQKMPADSCDYDPYGSYLSASDRDRKQREFIPDSKKDDKYWERRRKNNEAAKRSREKRRQNDILMEHRINLLNAQNNKLRQQLVELKMRFGLPLDDTDQTVGLDGVLLSPLSNGTQQQSSLMSGLTMTTEPRLRHSYKHITSDSLSQTSEVRQNMKRRASFEEDPKIPLSNGPHCDSNNSPANRPNGDGPQNQHSATLPTTSPNSNNVSTCSPPNGDSLPPKASQPLLPNLPQLGILDSTDLLTLKRIFSTLAMGANNLESLPPSSGGQTPSSPLLLDGIPTTSTVSSTLDPATAATAAWLFRQTMLLPTTHPLNIPSSGENHASATNGSHMEPSFLSNTLGSTSPLLQLTVVNSPQQPSTRTAESVETPLDLSLCMTAMNSDHQSNSGGLSSSSESKLLDKRYQDRRRRNNEAVRRCRENKRARMMGRAEVTDRLQTENRVLRTELTGLSLEVKALRKLLSTDKQQSPISKGSPAQSLSPLILKRSTSDSEASGDVQMNDRRDKQESGPLSVGDSAITTSVKEETGTEQREVRSEEVLTAISGHNGENDSVEVMDEESSTKSEESLMTADAPESLGSLNGLGNDIHSSELKLSDSRVTNGKCSRSSPHHAPRIQPQFSRGRRRLSKLTSGGRRGISSSDVSSVNGTNWLDDRCQATEFAQSIVRVHEFSTVRKSEDFIAS